MNQFVDILTFLLFATKFNICVLPQKDEDKENIIKLYVADWKNIK